MKRIPRPDSTVPRTSAAGTVRRVAVTIGGVPVPGSPITSEGVIALPAYPTPGGGSPAAHAASHQNGGTDEINVGGLSGLLADPQTPLPHTHDEYLTEAEADALYEPLGGGGGGGSPGALVLIATAVVSVAGSTITFDGIPQDYEDLVISGHGAGSASGYVAVRFNNDTGNNYDANRFTAWNSTNVAAENGVSYIRTGYFYASGSDKTNSFEAIISGYARNVFRKIARGTASDIDGTSASSIEQGIFNGVWRNTAPITRVDVIHVAGNFVVGSVVSLYGRGGGGGGGSGSGYREKLTADRTYYVRTDGNDANTGLVNSSAGAFLTIQTAINAAASVDCAGFQVKIQLGNGTYAEGLKLRTCLGVPAWTSVTAGGVVIIGDATTPSNVVISSGASRAFEADGVFSLWQIRGITVQTTGSASGVFASSARIYLSAFRFGSCGGAHIEAAGSGSTVWVLDNYTIAGGAARHWRSRGNAQIEVFSTTITLSGTPAFSVNFATCATGGVVTVNSAVTSFSGSATGTRYSAVSNGIIDTAGGGATYLPGNAAGAVATGGQYL